MGRATRITTTNFPTCFKLHTYPAALPTAEHDQSGTKKGQRRRRHKRYRQSRQPCGCIFRESESNIGRLGTNLIIGEQILGMCIPFLFNTGKDAHSQTERNTAVSMAIRFPSDLQRVLTMRCLPFEDIPRATKDMRTQKS